MYLIRALTLYSTHYNHVADNVYLQSWIDGAKKMYQLASAPPPLENGSSKILPLAHHSDLIKLALTSQEMITRRQTRVRLATSPITQFWCYSYRFQSTSGRQIKLLRSEQRCQVYSYKVLACGGGGSPSLAGVSLMLSVARPDWPRSCHPIGLHVAGPFLDMPSSMGTITIM